MPQQPPTLQAEIYTEHALFGGQRPIIEVAAGLTTFVGPNGTGKTQALRGMLRALRQQLGETKVRYLSAGRASPFERFRASADSPHGWDRSPAAVGNAGFISEWYKFESLTGDYLALSQQSDLRLKVEARLQTFLSRSINLTWSQSGLEVHIVPRRGGSRYTANSEASGILQLAALLAAIYNDHTDALLIDEPEASLHPQYQAFIMQELLAVAGDPAAAPGKKKYVVIATHAPSLLSIRSAAQLPNLIFFNDPNSLPIQISTDAAELKNRKLGALIARLTATHRLAFFARNVLLVEGPSDEIIATQLARVLQHPILPANTQIIPVTGKTEFGEAMRLFELMGKRVFVLADLDAVTDNNILVNHFSIAPTSHKAAQSAGHKSLADLDKAIRSDFVEAVSKHWASIESVASLHHYWANCPAIDRTITTQRRAVLATLMTIDADTLDRLSGTTEFSGLKQRFKVLFELMESVGFFVLRRGTIEDYFSATPTSNSKPEAAALEAETFDEIPVQTLEHQYLDVIRAIRASAPLRPIDENALLRERLGAGLGAIFQIIERNTPSEELNSRAQAAQPTFDIFDLENCSTDNDVRVRVKIKSELFTRPTFPFEISTSENPTLVIRSKLPSL